MPVNVYALVPVSVVNDTALDPLNGILNQSFAVGEVASVASSANDPVKPFPLNATVCNPSENP